MAASDLTPLMQQYRQIKHRYPDAFLFFRVGDFYEMFYDDAKNASKLLQITLTSRDKSQAEQVPLCGVPYHAASSYIAKLIRSGHKVAICEQVEDPKLAKTLVRREVIRVITPGTLLETDLLDIKESNYLAALYPSSAGVGLAYLDISTADFRLAEWAGPNAIKSAGQELAILHPSEVLVPESGPPLDLLSEPSKAICINRLPDDSFSHSFAYQTLTKQFRVETLNGFGCEGMRLAVSAAGALFNYVRNTQLTAPSNILSLKIHRTEDHLMLDAVTQRNLELTRRLADGQREGSLLATLDKTLTPMGARLLKDWLLHPLLDINGIRKRQDAVGIFYSDLLLRSRLRTSLKGVSDIERLISRIGLNVASGRDMIALKQSLQTLPSLRAGIGEIKTVSEIVTDIFSSWDDLGDIVSRIDQAIRDDAPPTLKDGGFIKDGYDPQIDELRAASRSGKDWIAAMEAKERQRTGIGSLKVRYNQVFGYYIEITKTHLKSIPPDYVRKQTMVNAERFITPELKEMEAKVLGAEEQIRQRELHLFEELRLRISHDTERVQKVARLIATLDVLCSLAETAVLYHYVRPEVNNDFRIRITDGRHPVLERIGSDLPADRPPGGGNRFIPNDTLLDDQDRRLLIITGPNMAGKSTYMRQVALIVLLAQVGSFVPAQEAVIGCVDRIFTRVGALDNIMAGQSTFMVEMTETATILHNATSRSLVLLDEIGRGTSTFDGLSIAWAVAEHLARIGSRTLFATHYHELTDLSLVCPGVRNMKAVVREWNDEIIFLRKIVEGGTDRSYGIQVARLAGLPPTVIQRAREVLTQLERWELNQAGRPRLAESQTSKEAPVPSQARLPEDVPPDGQEFLFKSPHKSSETAEKASPPADAGTRRPQPEGDGGVHG